MIHSWSLAPAVACLQAGGVIAYPTEAVFGLGCDPWSPAGLQRVLQVKTRPMHKGLILIAANQDQLEPFIRPLPPEWQQRLDASWPGPVTWILPARPEVPGMLTGRRRTLAVRVTDHPLTRALCTAWGGAIVSTSANRTGSRSARTAHEALFRLGAQVDLVVFGATGGRRLPSEIRDMRSGATLRKSDPEKPA